MPIEPRKTPRQARSAATVDAILEAAAHILRESGLHALNTNAVAQRAGASIGSLYQYFPNKDSILTELIRRKRQIMLDQIRAAARDTRGKPFARAIDRLVAAGIAHQLDEPTVSLALEYAEVMLPIHEETEALKIAIITEVAGVFARHGIIDAETAARDVVALTRGMIDTAGLYGESDPASLTQRVTRAVTGYLRTAPKIKKAG
ncbi:MAG: TetR family transcriptional regulator [Rhizobiales bacterium]|nr:TetR family transcriptional regulator [Hyphomicrobiales bacterium]